MKHERTADGGLRLELDLREARLLRYLAERATFVDTPPGEQEAIFDLAEQILTAPGQETRP
jgi:hypothetical protein